MLVKKQKSLCALVPLEKAVSNSLPSSGLASGRQTLHPPLPAHRK